MAKPQPLPDDSFNRLLVSLNMLSLKFNGPAYLIYDQDYEVAEAKVREDKDLFMLFQFAPYKAISTISWKLKILLEFYKIDHQNLSIFDIDVLRFLEMFEPIMDDGRFIKWWKINEMQEDNGGMYTLVQWAYTVKDVKF